MALTVSAVHAAVTRTELAYLLVHTSMKLISYGIETRAGTVTPRDVSICTQQH
jgi:hypothetical protein